MMHVWCQGSSPPGPPSLYSVLHYAQVSIILKNKGSIPRRQSHEIKGKESVSSFHDNAGNVAVSCHMACLFSFTLVWPTKLVKPISLHLCQLDSHQMYELLTISPPMKDPQVGRSSQDRLLQEEGYLWSSTLPVLEKEDSNCLS